MKKGLQKLIFVLGLTIGALSSASTVYLLEDLKLDNVDVHSGIVLNQKDGISEIKGYRKKGDTTIYATKNLSLELAKVKDSSIVRVVKDGDTQEVILSLNIDSEKLAEDSYDAWEEKEEVFLEKCSQCHASPDIAHHTMLEWEGLYISMKGFAQPTDEEEVIILRYLKTFAKDGIIKEEE